MNPRARIGEKNGRAKLNAQQVEEIRQTRERLQNDPGLVVRLAARFGVHHTTIYRALRRWTWNASDGSGPAPAAVSDN